MLWAVVFCSPVIARSAAEERASARATCPPRVGAGRIVCQVTLTVPAEDRIRWADVVVVEAPSFALPLRSRVVASLPEQGARETQLAVPLFGTAEGTGTVALRVRAVVCAKGSQTHCDTLTRKLEAAVAVTGEAT